MRPLALLTGALLTLSVAATAQTTTPDADLRLGREYLAAKNYESAAWRFETVVRRTPASAEAHLLLGQCYAQLGRLPEARTELTRAVELNPAYKDQAATLQAQADNQAQTTASAQVRGQAEAAAVRARAAAALQARAEAEAAAKAGGMRATPVANAQLVYGDYVCTLNAFDAASRRMSFVPKGTIQLNANGTYRYLEGGGSVGRYTYDTATHQVSWITGYFAEHGQSKTTFSTTDKATQLDIEFSTAGGTQSWSCGCNQK